jgi:hypothetical protein
LKTLQSDDRNRFSTEEIYMKQELPITWPNQSDVITAPDKKTSVDPSATAQKREDSAALFVTKFTNH